MPNKDLRIQLPESKCFNLTESKPNLMLNQTKSNQIKLFKLDNARSGCSVMSMSTILITCYCHINRRRCRVCLVYCLARIFTTVRGQDFFNNESAVLPNLCNVGPCIHRNIIFCPSYFLSRFISLASQCKSFTFQWKGERSWRHRDNWFLWR